MSSTKTAPEAVTLPDAGLQPVRVHANLSAAQLMEHAIRRGEGHLTNAGAFTAVTSPHTGRSPNDK
ncbi:MAG: phosphoenolpyruvate carboxykinase (ATP), partial [Gemmatimonadetes bacterium]|nr:phosphoenolpyruvate carboxykinase (ATP) [Gemmatimonadota bacterium]